MRSLYENHVGRSKIINPKECLTPILLAFPLKVPLRFLVPKAKNFHALFPTDTYFKFTP